ncbi:hypothetical protein [Bradyrhizobium sp. SZCCHNRI1058]|uniref:hyaluronate lyase N-terminal domain-containing protein n=1 Tax=Bradyrhizobium sp. SZCCHNRI1058 TaxID=3057279 RepID=UPI0029171417|nr:hypothetical protein [Bradyrhizobium sp. SZCCHNRI1058]
MARSQVQHSHGTAAEIATRTGVAREIWVDTTNERLVLMNGTTPGGKPMASEAYVNSQVAAVSGGSGGGGGAFVQWSTCV